MAVIGSVHVHARGEVVTRELVLSALRDAIAEVESDIGTLFLDRGDYVTVLVEGLEIVVHGGVLPTETEDDDEDDMEV